MTWTVVALSAVLLLTLRLARPYYEGSGRMRRHTPHLLTYLENVRGDVHLTMRPKNRDAFEAYCMSEDPTSPEVWTRHLGPYGYGWESKAVWVMRTYRIVTWAAWLLLVDAFTRVLNDGVGIYNATGDLPAPPVLLAVAFTSLLFVWLRRKGEPVAQVQGYLDGYKDAVTFYESRMLRIMEATKDAGGAGKAASLGFAFILIRAVSEDSDEDFEKFAETLSR